MRVGFIVACLALWVPAAASAQPSNPMLTQVNQVKDLAFPTEPSELGRFSTAAMAIYKPEGPGPFPALVILHQCGGLRQGNWQNASILEWARTAVARGYVAFVVDSLGQRGTLTLCPNPGQPSPAVNVTYARGVRDMYQAAAHLARFGFVDKDRIALAGFSWGAANAALAGSEAWAAALSPGPRFVAIVGFYPPCWATPANAPRYPIVRTDVRTPLLVLMGEKDNETPPADCLPLLENAKASGAPVDWHVYPDASHCWDCANLDRFAKWDSGGNRIVYRYSAAFTEDSARRMFDLIERAVAKR